MKRGFTLIELMVAIATIAVLIALLLPEIQKAQDASLKHKQQAGPYWVYREYEYAGGPVISEISGTYKHSLQEILDMYAIELKKQQKAHARELQNEFDSESASATEPALASAPAESAKKSAVPAPVWQTSYVNETKEESLSKAEKISKTKRALKNFKYDLSQNTASLVARRNVAEAIEMLEKDLKRLESEL